MLQAMNTGHEGSLSTCHANSPSDALARIETMILMGADAVPLAAIRAQMASAIDLVVQVVRDPDGVRRIADLHEVRAPAEADEAGGAVRTRSLLRSGRLASLPARPARCASSPPEPAWVER